MTDTTRPTDSTSGGLWLACLSVSAFALSPAFSSAAYAAGAGPWTLSIARGLFMALIFFPSFATLGRLIHDRMALRILAVIALPYAIFTICYQVAIAEMGAGLPLIIISCNPLLILFWNRLNGRTEAGLIEGLAALVSIAGVVLLTADPRVTPLGLVLALAGMVLTAVMTIGIERAAEHAIPRGARNLAMGLGNLLCLAPGIVWIEGLQLPAGGIGWTAFILSSVAMVTGIYAFTAAIAKLGALRMSLISNAEPAVGLIAAWIIAGEAVTSISLVGAALAATGLIDWRKLLVRPATQE